MFAPLTSEGNIVVDGVLASCYASFDHDLEKIAMTPLQWLPGMIEWIFGWDNDIPGYIKATISVGTYVMPNNYLNARTDLEKRTFHC